ncbi:MAG: hypothetical protein JST32_08800 [Bacteroidetes bacterium]|nr:hypothetical protein [Bacteroidota bacterium]
MLLYSVAHAQLNKFKYRVDVQKVDSNGVFKISLLPAFIAKCSDKGLYDIRLADEKGRTVAFSIMTAPMDKSRAIFNLFPEIKRNVKDTIATEYIADAGSGNEIDELWIRLKSNAVTRMASLSGSDDLQRWYAIKEDIELSGDGTGNGAEYEQQLTFPPSKYHYYRVHIDNKKRDPLQITAAGIYVASDQIPQLVSVAKVLKPQMIQGRKQTSYFIDLGDDYQVDALALNIASPKYYSRRAIVYNISGKNEVQLADDSIKSGEQNYLAFSAKTGKIRIDITNGDDNSLVIKDVDVLELKKFAVAYLEKNHAYYLLAGDSTASELGYDLTFLHSKPMSAFPVINHSAIYKNPAFNMPMASVPHHNFALLLWVAIIIVLLILSLLTWRMTKELDAKLKE